jgi:hypothetical protein
MRRYRVEAEPASALAPQEWVKFIGWDNQRKSQEA